MRAESSRWKKAHEVESFELVAASHEGRFRCLVQAHHTSGRCPGSARRSVEAPMSERGFDIVEPRPRCHGLRSRTGTAAQPGR